MSMPTIYILADGESKQIYKMITNSSKHEYILFFKYASMNSRTRKATTGVASLHFQKMIKKS